MSDPQFDHDASVSDWRQKLPDVAWLTALMSAIGNLEGKRILDCGCGSGMYTAQVRSAGGIPTGIDYDSTALALATSNNRNMGAFVRARLDHLPIASGAHDVALFRYVIHQIPTTDRAAVLGETHRILKDGGLLAIEAAYVEQAVLHFDHQVFEPLRRIISAAYPARDELLSTLMSQGFSSIREVDMVRKSGQYVSMEDALSNSARLVEFGRGPSTWRQLSQMERENFHRQRTLMLPKMFPDGRVPRGWNGVLIVAAR